MRQTSIHGSECLSGLRLSSGSKTRLRPDFTASGDGQAERASCDARSQALVVELRLAPGVLLAGHPVARRIVQASFLPHADLLRPCFDRGRILVEGDE